MDYITIILPLFVKAKVQDGIFIADSTLSNYYIECTSCPIVGLNTL